MKTISQKLREHALSSEGACMFHDLPRLIQANIADHKDRHLEHWNSMRLDERRLFCLFIAEALETS